MDELMDGQRDRYKNILGGKGEDTDKNFDSKPVSVIHNAKVIQGHCKGSILGKRELNKQKAD